MRWSETAPDAGGYNKCDFVITWPQGGTYEGRYDLKHHTCVAPSRRGHVQDVAECYSGQKRPAHMTQAQYEDWIKKHMGEESAAYAEVLRTLEALGEFAKVRPVRVDLQTLIAGGMQPAELVGLGVNYSGDAANKGGCGAIVAAEPCKWDGLKVEVLLENGESHHCKGRDFAESVGSRYALNWKHHGAPYLAQLQAAQAAKKASDTSAKEQRLHAHTQDLARLSVEFAHLERAENKHSGGVMAARNIRRMLKHAFKAAYPAVKFSVKSDYSSCSVSWADGPSQDQVDKLLSPFQTGRSDTQTDYFYTVNTAWSELFGGVQYLSTYRHYSEPMVMGAIALEFAGHAEQPSFEDWKKHTGLLSYDLSYASALNRRLRSTSAPTDAKA
jgi:hypothetical protein